MSADTDPIRSAAADAAAAPLDLLLTDAATGMLRRMNPGGSGLSLAAALASRLAKECPQDPQRWLRREQTCHGSWRPGYADWLAERSGEDKAAAGELGGGGLAPAGDAPGTYVYDH